MFLLDFRGLKSDHFFDFSFLFIFFFFFLICFLFFSFFFPWSFEPFFGGFGVEKRSTPFFQNYVFGRFEPPHLIELVVLNRMLQISRQMDPCIRFLKPFCILPGGWCRIVSFHRSNHPTSCQKGSFLHCHDLKRFELMTATRFACFFQFSVLLLSLAFLLVAYFSKRLCLPVGS